jgi:3-oxoacyl-[acyl-carrier-protein] synthase III
MTEARGETHLLAVGTELPGPAIDNARVARRLGMDRMWQQWIDTFIGTRSRHLAIDLETGERRYSLADLAEAAGERALAGAGVEPGAVDLVVMGTSTPDMLMPATVNMVADRLGIDGVPTYQLQSGCAGAFQALSVAWHLLTSGEHRTALVIGADSCAKHVDMTIDPSKLPPAELVNIVLFGDGAGAAVLSTDPAPGSVVVRRVMNQLTGLNRPPGQSIEWFGAGELSSGPLDRLPASEDYKAIEESVPMMAAEILKELLDGLNWARSEVSYLLPPQLSGRMTRKIVEHLAMVDAREVSCVTETGNNGNALPFLQLERLLPRMAPGDRAVGIGVESSKWIKAGFALERT